jgi:uncharacterized protein
MEKFISKIFEVHGQYFLYNDSTMSLISIEKNIADKVDKEHLSSLLTSYPHISNLGNETNDFKHIDRITLCVSNDCNLRCRYCYAQGGNYGSPKALMSMDTAKSFVSFCKNCFESIRKIVFFGGEPLLNPNVIEFVCKEITRLYEEKNQLVPEFYIITNGTILNSASIRLIERYINRVTVSIDGPQILHDYNRIYTNGKGSYNTVIKFIEQIKTIGNVKLSYEATFTQKAVDEGFSHASLKKFFKNVLGINGAIVDDSHLEKNVSIDYMKSITRPQLIKSNFECLPADFWRILDLLVKRKNNLFCNIGYRNISISVNGEIFVCHLLNGKNKCGLGNITSDNLYNHPEEFKNTICDVNKENQVCMQCWCKNLCGGCTVEYFYDKQTESLGNTPNPELCESRHRYVEQILMHVAAIRMDKDLWKLLIKKLSVR